MSRSTKKGPAIDAKLMKKVEAVKKANDKTAEPGIRSEYDFSHGARGKYARRYAQGANVVVLEADVAKVFPNAETVNDSLRALAGIIRRQRKGLVGRPLGE